MRIGQRLRVFRKEFRHFLRGFEVIIIAVEPHAVWIIHRLPHLNAQKHIMELAVFPVDVVTIIGRCQTDAILLRQFNQPGIRLAFLRKPMILNLQIKMILAENRQILLHQCLGFFFIILKDSARYLSCNAGGQTDDPFMILAQQFFIDTGLIIHPLNIGKRNQFDEIFIPRLIFRQKDQMIIFDPAGLLPILTRSRRQIHLTADNRFNSLLLALFIKSITPYMAP